MYTISLEDGDGDERSIGHRDSLAEAQALAVQWVAEATTYRIARVHIRYDGNPIETFCTGYMCLSEAEQKRSGSEATDEG